MAALIDNALKIGDLLVFGFPDGKGGCTISERESKDQLRAVTSFHPWIAADVREMVSHETGKEVVRGVWKAVAESAAAITR
jgi:hypothetical protein